MKKRRPYRKFLKFEIAGKTDYLYPKVFGVRLPTSVAGYYLREDGSSNTQLVRQVLVQAALDAGAVE